MCEDTADTQELIAEFRHFADIVPLELLNVEDSVAAFNRDYWESERELRQAKAELEAALAEKRSQLKRSEEDAIRKRDELRSTVAEADATVNALKNSMAELMSRCQAVEQLKSAEDTENKEQPTEDEVKQLMNRVVLKEMKKEEEQAKLVKERDSILSLMHLYKRWLDCHVEYRPPDEFVFSFESRKKWSESGTTVWIRLKASDDMRRWQLVEMAGDPPCFTELSDRLRQTNDIRSVVVDARKFYCQSGPQ